VKGEKTTMGIMHSDAFREGLIQTVDKRSITVCKRWVIPMAGAVIRCSQS